MESSKESKITVPAWKRKKKQNMEQNIQELQKVCGKGIVGKEFYMWSS